LFRWDTEPFPFWSLDDDARMAKVFLCKRRAMTCYAALRIVLIFNHRYRVYNVTLDPSVKSNCHSSIRTADPSSQSFQRPRMFWSWVCCGLGFYLTVERWGTVMGCSRLEKREDTVVEVWRRSCWVRFWWLVCVCVLFL